MKEIIIPGMMFIILLFAQFTGQSEETKAIYYIGLMIVISIFLTNKDK